ncbi:MAG: 50S ribosomal protein L24 [Verrucomicrobia bacterium]|nr:MAG: 50S ribosomal protein L24 [Verrucomicrobiota bacterium]
MHVKRGDEVVVINGAHKGKRGKILEVFPKKQRAIVEGVNIVKKHVRKSEENPEGGIVEREAPLHVSKLMLAEKYDARRAKRGAAA